MDIFILDLAQKEFEKLPDEVREKFYALFDSISKGTKLEPGKFKKLKNTKLFEFRVKHNTDIYRGIGGYILPNFIVTVFFQKKTQKTPLKELETAIKRLNKFLINK